MARRWAAGDVVPARTLETIHGDTIGIPGNHLTHLQFRRFAGCPVCNLHLRTFVQRHDELAEAGITEIVFFHSTTAELMEHAAGLPLAVIADPTKKHYADFGAEAGKRALLNPRAWGPILKALTLSLTSRAKAPKLFPDGGRYGLPADLLIDAGGRVLAVKYGEHAYDQWSVDELLTLAGKPATRQAR